jgi:DNA-binding HxlR family transcriptional regulator
VELALDVLMDRWTFLILREAFFGVRRYGQMQRNLGIARNVLADRLSRLVANGMFERVRYRTDPDWYEYRLTDRALDLYPVIIGLMRWADTHLAGTAELHRRAADAPGCGAATEPHFRPPAPPPSPWPGATSRPRSSAPPDGRGTARHPGRPRAARHARAGLTPACGMRQHPALMWLSALAGQGHKDRVAQPARSGHGARRLGRAGMLVWVAAGKVLGQIEHERFWLGWQRSRWRLPRS